MNAIDSNILIYSVDTRDPAKKQRANELLNQLAPRDDGTATAKTHHHPAAASAAAMLQDNMDQRSQRGSFIGF